MGLPLKVVKTNRREENWEPYLLYIGGWTEKRYFAEAPETGYVEFCDGELIVHAPVNIKHQQMVRFLTVLLAEYAGDNNLGEILCGPAVVRLHPGLNYEPDIFFVPLSHLSQLGKTYYSGPPALVIEVMSPATRNYDLKTKAALYSKHGVPEYWVIDPEGKIFYFHSLPENQKDPYHIKEYTEGRVQSQALPDFWLDVSWFWQEPLPAGLHCLRKILYP